jgi:hypothetical protein
MPLLAGWQQLREDRPLAAAEAWARAADEIAARGNRSEGWQSAAQANVLSAAAFQAANDQRAYARWALSVQQYLEVGTRWETQRALLAERVRRLERQLTQVSGDVPPSVSIEDRMVIDLSRRLGLLEFTSPRAGLTPAEGAVVQAQVVTPQYFAGAARGDEEQGVGTAQTRYAAPRREQVPDAQLAARRDRTVPGAAAPARIERAAPAVLAAPGVASAAAFEQQTRLRGAPPLAQSAPATAAAAATRAAARQNAALPRSFVATASDSLLTPQLEAAARDAWRYVSANRQSATGLVNGKDSYPVATVADIAHTLAALLAARELGLIETDRLEAEARQILTVLMQLPLYGNELFNREYDTRSGRMLDLAAKVSVQGSGWAADDHGRLLLWLKLLSREVPALAAPAARVVERLRLGRLVGSGRLHSALLVDGRESLEPDLRLGQQQVTAAALWLWGIELPGELNYEHAYKRSVGALVSAADARDGHRVAPDAFARGLVELGGLDGCFEAAARLVLDAQHALARTLGTPVMVADELLDREPWFVFGALAEAQQPWFVASFDRVPRPALATFSVKAAYLWAAVDRAPATLAARGSAESLERSERGLHGGRYSNGKGNLALTLETNASVLVAAWHAKRGGQPLLQFDNPTDFDCPELSPHAPSRR